tara:strand:+ start:132 stop:503 length:372 start_codon:yes stop_codon:yes gene_type:complete
MYNKKYFVWFLILLSLITLINLFTAVTVEFSANSFVEYRKFILNCGTVYEILFTDIEYTEKKLRMNEVVCYNNAILKVLNVILSLIAIFIIFKFGIKFINNKTNREDLSDLLLILRRRNKRDI